jgi:N-methylhydantoinase B
MKKVDPITLEVMRNAFQSVAEEMGAALIRTALSPNIKDRRDCSTAIYTNKGELVAQAEHIPLHLGLMSSVVKKVLEYYPVAQMRQGDAIITNDPYISGSHLPDICMITPVFTHGKCAAIVANLAHHVDVGGIAPGGMPTVSREIFQEGIIIPPVRLKKNGNLDEEMLRLITSNVRTSYESKGDFSAQLAANNVGEKRLVEIVTKHGEDKISLYMNELIKYSKRRMLVAISKLPNGTFDFEDYLEGDGIEDKRLKIKATITIEDKKIIVDFTGTSDQAKGSVNATRAVTLACVYYSLKSVIGPDLPSSDGTFQPVEVITPLGTIVNPRFPAPVSNANVNTSQRIADVVFGVLFKVIPKSVPAASTGSMSIFTIGGINPDTKEYFSYVETYGGGQGAVFDKDGMDGVHTNMTNTRNTPVEVIEITYPLRVEKYGLVQDSEGAGKHRGGLGLTREITILADDVTVSLGTERREISPWGLDGGSSGGSSNSWVKSEKGEKKILPSKVTTVLNSNTKIVLQTAGGGGYGHAFERKEEDVLNDIVQGFITIDKAEKEYGVALEPNKIKINKPQTDILRK